MGSFTFKWPHAAEEVYVTGTFDDWQKTVKLDKVGDMFEKTVALPPAKEKIYYKFVVDGNWTTDHTAPQDKDHEGNENNILNPQDILMDPFINTVSPTAGKLASEVPVEETKDLPGAFPETPATDLDKQVSVNPLPAADGAVNPVETAPGDKIPDVSAADVDKHVTLDKEAYDAPSDRLPGSDAPAADLNKELSVKPLPAADFGINPIALAPGAKIPDSLTTANVDKNVTLDEESYKKSDRLPGLDKELPPITSNMIPESSLPMPAAGDFTINTFAPTTGALAAAVPLEEQGAVAPEVPAEVKDSIAAAGESPEAAASSAAVEAKRDVETQLKEEIKPVEPAAQTPVAEPAVAQPAETNGAGPVAADAAAKTDSPAPAAGDEALKRKKKGNRLSSLYTKVKNKISSKSKSPQ